MVRGWILATVLAVIATACGPIAYVNEVTRRAQTSVANAKAANAEKLAPYYYTRAVQYLHQARVAAARADFQGANRFGRLSSEAGDLAVTEAKVVAADPSKGPIILMPRSKSGIAPAKDVAPAKDIAPAKDDE